MTGRLIFHIDVNSAFLSWEAVKRVREGLGDLREIPSAIGGDRAERHGVILAKSLPAKQYGIKTGEPISQALQKCPSLVIAEPNFRLYQESSRAFSDILRKYAPVVEQFSIDECFLDFTGTSRLYPDPIALAHKIKDEIRDTLGFSVNIGISHNKLLSKMASDFEKPDRVHTLFAEELEEKFFPLPVRDLFTVGHATAERLETFGIRTIGELAKTDSSRLCSMFGKKSGEHLFRFANGIDDSPVLAEAEAAKGYSNSTTLSTDVVTIEEGYRVLLALSDSVTSRMRRNHCRAYCVAVTIRGNNFRDLSHQRTLPSPTNITSEVYEVAKKLFCELWDKRTPLRLLGLSLSQLTHEDNTQLSMFPDESLDREAELDRIIDGIRHRFGSDTIVRGSIMEYSRRVGKKHKQDPDKT